MKIVWIIWALIFLSGCSKPTPIYKVVEEIWWCDRYYCSVRFTDWTYGKADPSAGEAMKWAWMYIYK